VQNGFESVAFVGIVEDAFAQLLPVDPAVSIQDGITKDSDDFVITFLAGFRQGARDLIGIDDGHSTHHEQRRDGGFATANAAGQAYA
jgi:hypothetical protein